MGFIFKYDKEICSIKDCTNPIHKNFMCKEHYDFYVVDDKIKQVNEEIYLVETNKASLMLRAKKKMYFYIHHGLDVPLLYEEHFPLEHIFLYHNRIILRNKSVLVDIKKTKQIINDFDLPKNENIEELRCVVNNTKKVDDRLTEKEYKFTKDDCISSYPLLFALILSIIMIYLFNYKISCDSFINQEYCKVLSSYYAIIGKYIPLIIIIQLIGCSLIKSYNPLVNKAFNNDLFHKKSDNSIFLNQIVSIRNRSRKSGGYKATTIGALMPIAIVCVFSFMRSLNYSNSVFCSIVFVLCCTIVLTIMLYNYNVQVLYLRLIYIFKDKELAIRLYNPDKIGGSEALQKYIFRGFVYNEGLVILFAFMSAEFKNIWLGVILWVLLSFRMIGAGRFCRLYFSFIKQFKINKSKELSELRTKNTVTSFNKTKVLDDVHFSTWYSLLRKLLIVIVIPAIISIVSSNPIASKEQFLNVYNFILSLFM